MAYNTPPAGPAGGDLTGSSYPNPVVVSIGGKSLTLGASLAVSGAFATTLTVTGVTNLTLPTSGTLTALGNTTTGSGSIVLATSPTIAAPTLTGNTTLPGAGQISSVGNIGIGMTPVNPLDITKTQNASSIISLLNASTGTGASSTITATNGTSTANFRQYGTGFTTTGIQRADGTIIFGGGGGGLTVTTSVAQPIYFGVNLVQVGEFATTGNLLINTTTDDGVNKLQVSGGIKATNITATGAARVLATNTSGQSILSGSGVTITGWTTTFDANSNFNAATGVFTAPLAGFYLVTAQIGFNGTMAVGTSIIVPILANGVTRASGSLIVSNATVTINFVQASALVQLAVGQTITLQAFQNSGGAAPLTAGASSVYVSITQMP